jgi:hypothetical protein
MAEARILSQLSEPTSSLFSSPKGDRQQQPRHNPTAWAARSDQAHRLLQTLGLAIRQSQGCW